MSGGEVAALIAAVAFLALVAVIAIPVLRLRHTVDAATRAVNDLADRTGPILNNVDEAVRRVNATLGQVQTSLDGVNVQLARVDTITSYAAQMTANVANLISVVTSALANPLAKAAAFAFGLRRAARRRTAENEPRARGKRTAQEKGRE